MQKLQKRPPQYIQSNVSNLIVKYFNYHREKNLISKNLQVKEMNELRPRNTVYKFVG